MKTQSHSTRSGALQLVALESCKIWSNIAYLELLLDHPDPSLTASLRACASNKRSWKAQFRRGQALVALQRFPEAAEAFVIAHDRNDSTRTAGDKNKLVKLIEEARANSIVPIPPVFDRAAAVAKTGRFRFLLDQVINNTPYQLSLLSYLTIITRSHIIRRVP